MIRLRLPARAGSVVAALVALSALTFAVLAAPAAAQPAELPAPGAPQEEFDRQFRVWDELIERAERLVAADEISTPAFESLRERLAEQRTQTRALADRAAAGARPVIALRDALGPPPEDGRAEPDQIARDRAELTERIDLLEGRARRAELTYTRTRTAIDEIDALIRSRFARQLTTLGPSPLNPVIWPQAALELVQTTERLGNEVRFSLADPVRAEERRSRLPLAGAALLAAVVLAFWVRARLIALIERWVTPDSSRGRRVAGAALSALARLAAPAAALGVALVALNAARLGGPLGTPLVEGLTVGLALLIAARGLAGAFYAPNAPHLRLSDLNDDDAAAASRAAFALGAAVCVHFALVRPGEAIGLSPATLSLLNGGVTLFGALALFALSRHVLSREAPAETPDEAEETAPPLAAQPEEDPSRIGRRIAWTAGLTMKIAAVASVVLAAAGYYAASQYALLPVALSLGVICAGIIVFVIIRDGVDAYLAESAGDSDGGLRLLPIFVGFLIVLITAPILALVWGARPTDLIDFWDTIVAGVDVGGLRLSPLALLTFTIVFGIGYTLTRLLQSVLAGSVLSKTKMDPGGRVALTSGLGYVGIGIALIIGVSAAGLDLSSLAIVAGALSVGIGFGLQTIVNNFVSGIILLVERPIKVGDWIEVGGTHGIVKRISVRATEIEGFDRSALILPNSELISGRVTNYTHENVLGRVIVSVGVAYGTDVRRVESILLELARAETRALRYPPPRVFFMGFGADSLNFDVHLVLREVTTRLSVMSDMHFAIDKRFKEEGIEIPFAQRVLHIQDPERLAAAFRGDPPATAPAAASGPAGGGAAGQGADPAPAPAPASGANIT